MALINLPQLPQPGFRFPAALAPTTQYGQATGMQALTGLFGMLKPMPDYVSRNINLGWDYLRGQVIPPLPATQKPLVPPMNLPPLVRLPAMTPTPGPGRVMPGNQFAWGMPATVAAGPQVFAPVRPTAQFMPTGAVK